ncbi:MAG: hypothetical protein P8J32_02900 [bacterium]|nr:hypothetical protein [bacterium]
MQCSSERVVPKMQATAKLSTTYHIDMNAPTLLEVGIPKAGGCHRCYDFGFTQDEGGIVMKFHNQTSHNPSQYPTKLTELTVNELLAAIERVEKIPATDQNPSVSLKADMTQTWGSSEASYCNLDCQLVATGCDGETYSCEVVLPEYLGLEGFTFSFKRIV